MGFVLEEQPQPEPRFVLEEPPSLWERAKDLISSGIVEPLSQVPSRLAQPLSNITPQAIGQAVNKVLPEQIPLGPIPGALKAVGDVAALPVLPPSTYEGRPLVRNPDGSVSHERTITIEENGLHMNIPTMFGGKQYTPRQAVEIMRKNNWVDPDSGRYIQGFKSQAEALQAAQAKEAYQQTINPGASILGHPAIRERVTRLLQAPPENSFAGLVYKGLPFPPLVEALLHPGTLQSTAAAQQGINPLPELMTEPFGRAISGLEQAGEPGHQAAKLITDYMAMLPATAGLMGGIRPAATFLKNAAMEEWATRNTPRALPIKAPIEAPVAAPVPPPPVTYNDAYNRVMAAANEGIGGAVEPPLEKSPVPAAPPPPPLVSAQEAQLSPQSAVLGTQPGKWVTTKAGNKMWVAQEEPPVTRAPLQLPPPPMTEVYHGSPYDFTRFDSSKIGLGQGAQTYGYGVYLAENPKVAGSYIPEKVIVHNSADRYWVARGDERPSGVYFNTRQEAEGVAAIINQGGLYQAKIPKSVIGKMLDYDKPLSEQPKSVQDAVKSSFPNGWVGPKDPTGNQIIEMFGGFQSNEGMKKAGIPGIKYLDEGSRTTHKGTRNLVVFDTSLLGEAKKLPPPPPIAPEEAPVIPEPVVAPKFETVGEQKAYEHGAQDARTGFTYVNPNWSDKETMVAARGAGDARRAKPEAPPIAPEPLPIPEAAKPPVTKIEPWKMTRESFAKSAEPNKIPAAYTALKAISERNNRAYYDPEAITPTAVGQLKKQGLISGTKNLKLTSSGIDKIYEWDKLNHENFMASGDAFDTHIDYVEQAIKEGKPVPANVLKDYPDLQKTAAPAEASAPAPPPAIEQAAGEQTPKGTIEGFPDVRLTPKDVPQSITPLKRNYIPPGENQGQAITRRGDIVRYLEDNLNVPVRTGHANFAQMKASGFFKVDAEVIRTKMANDVETVAHEVGHYLDKKILNRTIAGIPKDARAELVTMGHDLYGDRVPSAGYTREGIAEYVRFYVTDPATAAAKAPKFAQFFDEVMTNRFPDVKETLQTARADWTRYNKQPAVNRVLSQISVGEKASRPITLDGLYTKAFDDLHMIKVFEDRATKGQPPIAPSDSPYTLARIFRGWVGKADEFMTNGPIDFNTYQKIPGTKGLNEIIGPFAKNLDDLRAYLTARHALEWQTLGKETGIKESDVNATMAHYANRPELPQAAADLKVYQDGLLDYAQKSGLLSADQVTRFKERYPGYVPFYRLMDDEMGGTTPGTKKFANLGTPFKAAKGSDRPIIDPLESIVKNTYSIINLADRNVIGQKVAALGKIEGMGKYVEQIPRDKIPLVLREPDIAKLLEKLGVSEKVDIPPEMVAAFRPTPKIPGMDNVISVRQNGQSTWYQVHPDLYEAMAGLNPAQSSAIIRILSLPARALRLGATTLSPEFSARNPMRDAWTAALYTKYGILRAPGEDFIRGLSHVIKGDEMYQAWKAGGGEHSMLVSLDRGSLQKTLQDVIDSGEAKGLAKTIIRHPIDSLRAISEYGEEATRLGEFARSIRENKGLTKDNIIRAALDSREITVDFARRGSSEAIRNMNQITAFLNANLQSWDKMGRFARDNPGLFMARSLATITAPSLMLWALNKDDPRYRDLPRWQKDLFWILPTGHMDTTTWNSMDPQQKAKFNGEHTIWRIPKPFEPGLLFGSLPERFLDWAYNYDPEAINNWAKNLIQSGPTPIPNAVLPLIENYGNWNWFLGRRIVPRGKEDLSPEYQYATYTTEPAKAIGKAVGYSPAKIENLLQGWLGGAGRLGLDAAQKMMGMETQKPEVAKTWADIPLVRGFVARSPGQPESVERFFEEYANVNQAKANYQDMLRQQKYPEARQYLNENRKLIYRDQPRMAAAAAQMTKIRQQADQVRNNPSLTPEQRLLKLDALNYQQAQIAQRHISSKPSGNPTISLAPPIPPVQPRFVPEY